MLALALLLFAAAPAIDRGAATSALLKGLVADGEPGLAVLVRRNGRTVFERGYGVRDLRARAPIDPRTRFRLGSVTKQMTAAAIMLLVRDGRLRYEDTLTQALPGFPAYGSGVTIRHLLTHTGGLPDYEQLMESAEKEKGTIWTSEDQIRDDEVLALLEKETRGLFTPGTSWAYSNSGYVILGLVAARAAGRPFGDVLRERIFAPLGMTRTLAYERGKNEVPDRAYGHTKEPTRFRETDQSPTSATLGDGGVYSCLEDLAKWDEALRTNALLSKAEMASALTPVRLTDGSQPLWPKGEQGGDNLFPGRPVAYGFGWFLDPWQGRKRAWHHGETMGFRSIVERFLADGVSVVVLANRGDIDLKSLALEIAEAELGRAPRGATPHEDRVPVGGATLYARDVGRGQPIVVLHGGPDFDHSYLLPDMDRLSNSFRLIYYDQRGRGKSADGVRAEDVTLASDIADLDKVREHFQLGSTAVLGHSWGTVLALEYAIRHPARVSHLILMNPAPASAADYRQFRKERLETLGADLDRLRAVAATDGFKAGDPDAVAAYYRIHFKAALRRPADYERLMARMRPSFTTSEAILKARHVEDRLMADTWSLDGYDLLPKIRSLTIPTLVIYGDHDFIPSFAAEHIAEALPAARFVTMKECGHFAYLECPGPVRKEIDRFFRNPAAPARQTEPELPRVFLDTTYSPPTHGKLIAVNAGGDLQAALHASQPGDVIEIQAGATFTGNFILPKKSGTDWIYIRSSAHALLPHPGTRVFPSHASLMPKIDTPNRAPAITTAAAAHHYRFVGIEVTARGATKSTGPYSDNNVVYLESEGGQTSLSQVPTDIILDRCYIHGTPTGSVRRGIAMNGARMAVVDSYLSDFHEGGADSQAISGWNGPGPFKIVNNYLEGAGENLMFGGADPPIPDLVPSDIEIRRNHFFKPLSWKIGHPTYAGTPWSVKNIFELKNARRVLAEGNLLENNWQHDQNGFAILFTVRNQDGGAPWCTVEDVTFRKNVLRHSGGGFNILAADNNFPSQQTRRILIQDNLLDDISSVNWGGTGRLFQFLSLDSRDTGILGLTVEHNTGFSNAWSAYTGDKPIAVHRSFTFRNNIAPKRTHGFAGGTKSWPVPSPLVTGDGSQTLNTFYLAPVFAGNVLTGSTPANYSGYPGNFFPATDAEVGFVDLSRGNYRLGPASVYKNAATDGKDPGAAIDALEAATAGAVSGDWTTGSFPRP